MERKLRHIIETGLALLATASLPFKFWLYVFHTTIFLINRLPTKVLNYQSPFQILFGKSPNYHIFKIFGCLCYPYIRPYNKNKLSYRSSQCIFLGYSSNHKGYTCLDPLSGRLYVVFHETVFPFQSTPDQSSSVVTVPTPVLLPFSSPPMSSLPSHTTPSTSSPPLTNMPSSTTSLLDLIQVPFVDISTSKPHPTNQHPMVTRAKNGISKKKVYFSSHISEPTTFT